MKKLLFALALVSLVFTSAQAQKQLGGEHNIELNLTPFGDSPIDGTSLKYRYFLDDDKAVRVTLMFDHSSDVMTYLQTGEQYFDEGNAQTTSEQLTTGTTTTMFGINAGYEMHFDGTDNLSPYFGFEGFFRNTSRKDFMDIWGPNQFNDIYDLTKYNVWQLENSQKNSEFGLNILVGADYYFNDAIYVGLEAGLGLGITNYGNHVISASDATAFQIQYNNATSNDEIVDIDEYVGQLEFDASTGFLYDNGVGIWIPTPTVDGQSGSELVEGFVANPLIGSTPYFQAGMTPDDNNRFNKLSGFEFGNYFNAAIRVGFLFN